MHLFFTNEYLTFHTAEKKIIKTSQVLRVFEVCPRINVCIYQRWNSSFLRVFFFKICPNAVVSQWDLINENFLSYWKLIISMKRCRQSKCVKGMRTSFQFLHSSENPWQRTWERIRICPTKKNELIYWISSHLELIF